MLVYDVSALRNPFSADSRGVGLRASPSFQPERVSPRRYGRQQDDAAFSSFGGGRGGGRREAAAGCKLYVGNVSFDMTKDDLSRLFDPSRRGAEISSAAATPRGYSVEASSAI